MRCEPLHYTCSLEVAFVTRRTSWQTSPSRSWMSLQRIPTRTSESWLRIGSAGACAVRSVPSRLTLLRCREKRMQELKDTLSRNKYGEFRQISEKEFIPEVSKAPEDVFVVCHLFIHRFASSPCRVAR